MPDPHYRELCQICRRTRASHEAKAAGTCREFAPPKTAPRRTPGPWTCERCGKGDNATRYHNTWEVTVAGELASDDDPDVGEYNDDFVHELELCDSCAKKRDGIAWALALALRLELAGLEPAENPEAIEVLRRGADQVGLELGPDHPARPRCAACGAKLERVGEKWSRVCGCPHDAPRGSRSSE